MNALHDLLPLAVGMLVSPLPIVAIVAILLSPRGRGAALAYTSTFTAVTLAFITIGALTSAGASSAASGTGARLVSLALSVVLALGFTALAVASWISRPKPGETPTAPKWLAAIDTVTPRAAAALGFVMAATNSKNIPLALKGGALIGEAHLPVLAAIALCVTLAIIASLALIVPTVLALSGSSRVAGGLQRVKSEMIAHNAVIMTVLFGMLGAIEAAQVVHHLIR